MEWLVISSTIINKNFSCTLLRSSNWWDGIPWAIDPLALSRKIAEIIKNWERRRSIQEVSIPSYPHHRKMPWLVTSDLAGFGFHAQKRQSALASMAQLVGASHQNWKVTGWIPSWGAKEKATNWCFSHINASLSHSLPLSLNQWKKNVLGWDLKKLKRQQEMDMEWGGTSKYSY